MSSGDASRGADDDTFRARLLARRVDPDGAPGDDRHQRIARRHSEGRPVVRVQLTSLAGSTECYLLGDDQLLVEVDGQPVLRVTADGVQT